jgi:hypothetical protein
MNEQQPLDTPIAHWMMRHTAKEFKALPEEHQSQIAANYTQKQSVDFYKGMITAISIKGLNPSFDYKFHLAFLSSLVVERTENK